MKGRNHSIRFALALWHIGVLSIALCIFGGVLYSSVAASLARDVNKALTLQAEGISHSIHAFWEAEQAARGLTPGNWVGAPSRSLADEAAMGRLSDLVGRWARQTRNSDGERPIAIVDRKGQILVSEAGFNPLPQLFMEHALLEGAGREPIYQTIRLPKERVRVITYPVLEEGRPIYFVQASASLSRADHSIQRLGWWLLALIPLTVIVTGTIGWFLVNRVLHPVAHLTSQAQRISAERLHQRVSVPKTGDELERLAATFNDMLERLERAFNRLRQFSGAASHELRTPLTVMKGELEVALRKPRESEEYQRVLRTHLRTIDEMTQTVEELLVLARNEAVQGVLEWRPVELGELAQAAGLSLRMLADRKAIQLEMRSQEPVWVRGERRLLERVVANLLDNAIRHTPAHGTVSVHTERRQHQACLVVRDTGPGIPVEELSKIFERFFKPRSSDSRVGSTGLGLGLCHWIAEAHHGFIEASSTTGQGATFTVWLPLIPPPS